MKHMINFMVVANMIAVPPVMLQKWIAAKTVNAVNPVMTVKIVAKLKPARWTVVKMVNAASPVMMVKIAAKTANARNPATMGKTVAQLLINHLKTGQDEKSIFYSAACLNGIFVTCPVYKSITPGNGAHLRYVQ
ncbi:MAG: hypothetical protein ACXWWD_07520 [Chitinophagaceae bacterium]